MLHQSSQKLYENHQLILDHLDQLDHQDVEDHVQSSQFYKKSNISSTSSPEPHYVMQPMQQFRVIKDGRHYEDGFRVSSSEMDQQQHHHHQQQHQMGPPPQTPTKSLKIISSEEPTSSMPDLGKFHDKYSAKRGRRFQTKSIKSPLRSPSISFSNSFYPNFTAVKNIEERQATSGRERKSMEKNRLVGH
jgi:hypothetical protein